MPEVNRTLAALMSADVVGYSRLMQDDDAATVATLQEYRTAIARVVERHKGRVVTEDLIVRLSRFPYFPVIARNLPTPPRGDAVASG